MTLDSQALHERIGYQNNPISLLEQPLSALLVLVQQSCQAFAAFPNGYFTSALEPAKNFAVAHHSSEAHGYELMGVGGASYLGFIRAEPPATSLANIVAKDFCSLYNTRDEALQAHIFAVAKAISRLTHLRLRYVE